MEISTLVSVNFMVFPHDAVLSEVVAKLQEFEKRSGLVFRNKKYLGMVEKRKLLHGHYTLTETNVEKIVLPTPILNGDTSIIEAARLFLTSDVDFLPVENGKEIIGVVSVLDIVKAALDLPDVSKLKVSDVKLVKPAKINATDSLQTALEVMFSEKVDYLPVYEKGEMSGLISYKEVMRRHLNWSPRRDTSINYNKNVRSRGARVDVESLDAVEVSSVVTDYNSATISSKETLQKALGYMQSLNRNELVVVDGDTPKGLLTSRGILSLLAALRKTQNYELSFVGMNKVQLTEHQKEMLQIVTEREAQKLQRKFSGPFSVAVHLKELSGEGKQRLFHVTVKLEIIGKGKVQTSTKEDWDLEKALHKCFNMVKLK